MTSQQTDNKKIMRMIQAVGDNVQTNMVEVQTRLGSLETNMVVVGERLGSLQTNMVVVGERLGSLQTNMVEVQTRLGSLETNMVVVGERLGSLETGMVDVRERLFRVEALEEHNGDSINRLAEAMMIHRKRTNLVPSMSARLRERALEAKTIKMAVRDTSLQVQSHEKRLTRLESTT